MRIWILRHGQAEARASIDPERALTDEGRKEVELIAGRLAAERIDTILASPYVRAQQTAELVRRSIGFGGHIATVPWLTPEDDPLQVLGFLSERTDPSLLLVSHQPLVSQLISLLVEGSRRGHYPMPTAGLACLETDFVAAGLARLDLLATPADSRSL